MYIITTFSIFILKTSFYVTVKASSISNTTNFQYRLIHLRYPSNQNFFMNMNSTYFDLYYWNTNCRHINFEYFYHLNSNEIIVSHFVSFCSEFASFDGNGEVGDCLPLFEKGICSVLGNCQSYLRRLNNSYDNYFRCGYLFQSALAITF